MAGSLVFLAFSCFIFKVITADLTFVDPQDINDTSLVVTLPDGQILGRRDTTVGKGDEYLSFRGIPFAKPPLRELRFRPPQKNDKWTGILNCTEDRSECIQQPNANLDGLSTDLTSITGSENCLYINVYTPNITGNLSVLVFIHGGVYYSGNSSYFSHGPDFLLEENVVYVAFNYRLSIFGFLTTGDLAAPGNWGIKDQVLALQWIHDNIARFGGNPNSVTISGESAGATSVSYLLQIDQTKGLLHGAIMESGTSLNLLSLSRKGVASTYQIASALQIDILNTTTMVESLRQVNVSTLYSTTLAVNDALYLENELAGLIEAPVIEPVHDGAVLTHKSYALLSQGLFHRVPCLMGFNSNEAITFVPPIDSLRAYLASNYDFIRDNLTPADMTTDLVKRILAGNIIEDAYASPSATLSTAPEANILELISDDQFVRGIREAALQQSQYVPVYLYEFGYEGYLGFQGGSRPVPGVGHMEELPYLYITGTDDVDPSLVTASDKLTRARMVRMWANMAKFGNPTPVADPLLQNVRWPLAGTNRSNVLYLNITTNLVPSSNPHPEKMAVYDFLYNQFGDKDYDTY